jgi:D-inositol-3-phosphate glycosyltransferase
MHKGRRNTYDNRKSSAERQSDCVQDAIESVTEPSAESPLIDRIAMLSVHTSPIAELGGPDSGGMNVYVNELGHWLARTGINVDIFTRRTDTFTPRILELDEGLRLIQVEAGPASQVHKDELFCHIPDFASDMAFFALQQGVRYDVVHGHYWLSGWAAQLLKEHWHAPTVQMYHTMAHLKNAVANGDHRETTLRLQIERRLVEITDGLIAANPHERKEMINKLGASPEQIHLVPPGVDLELFQPHDSQQAREILGLPDGPLILFVGRIDPVKGIDTLFEGFQHLLQSRDWTGEEPTLVFIGGIIDRENGEESMDRELRRVAEQAEALGVSDHVLFRGSQPREMLPLYYSAVDVCAVPSRYESFGLVAVEAMACGTPIVASQVGGLQFTIQDGQSGLLVPHSDPVALADALHRVLSDDDLYRRMCAGARRSAIRYSWQMVTSSVVDVYQQLIDQHQPIQIRLAR